MQEELIFSKIVNNTIFVDDYTKFEKNNVVTFSIVGLWFYMVRMEQERQVL